MNPFKMLSSCMISRESVSSEIGSSTSSFIFCISTEINLVMLSFPEVQERMNTCKKKQSNVKFVFHKRKD